MKKIKVSHLFLTFSLLITLPLDVYTYHKPACKTKKVTVIDLAKIKLNEAKHTLVNIKQELIARKKLVIGALIAAVTVSGLAVGYYYFNMLVVAPEVSGEQSNFSSPNITKDVNQEVVVNEQGDVSHENSQNIEVEMSLIDRLKAEYEKVCSDEKIIANKKKSADWENKTSSENKEYQEKISAQAIGFTTDEAVENAWKKYVSSAKYKDLKSLEQASAEVQKQKEELEKQLMSASEE